MAKNILDKAGSVGTLLAGAAIPCCFPLLSVAGSALGFGAFLFRYQRWMSYLMMAFAVLALAGSVLAFRTHRKPGPLVVAFVSTGLIIYGVNALLDTNFIYPGMAGLLAAAVWNMLETRRCEVRCEV